MNRRASHALLAFAAAFALGCGSDEKKPDPAPAATKPAAAKPATPPADPPPADDDGKIVIKGSKHADTDAPRDDASRRNQAKIDELTRQANEGGVTAKWIDWSSDDGRFMVALPQKPEETSQTLRGPKGDFAMRSVKVSLTKPDIRGYGVSWFDLQGDVPDKDAFLRTATKNVSATLKGQIVEEKSVSLDGSPGREARIEIQTGKEPVIAKVRLYMVGNRAYQLTAAAPKSEADGRDVTKFLESFKVTPAPVPATPDSAK
jgi:hypothetical protein